MEKMNCDIIRDLIPSYVDEVCSQATKECVEAHLDECGECRLIAARLRNSALSGEKLEQKGLDGMKKIKRALDYHRIVNYGILLVLALYGIELFLAHNTGYVIFNRPWILETVCIIAVLASGLGRRDTRSPGRTAYLCGVFSFVLSIYCILLFCSFIMQLKPDMETIFGMEARKIGPFMNLQTAVVFIAQIGFFLYNLGCIIKQKQNCRWLLCLNIMGVFLAVNYDLHLYYMDSFETLKRAYLYATLEAVVPGVLGAGVSMAIAGAQKRRGGGEA